MRHKKFSSIGKELNPKNLYRTNRTIKYIVVHCSANKFNSLLGTTYIDREHLRRWGKNSGCGYHYIVKTGGRLEKGRWVDYPGAHVYGYNSHSIGIAYIGGLDENLVATNNLLPDRQYSVLINTIRELSKLYPEAKILGHNEFPGVNKACPCLDMDRLRRGIEGRLF